MAKSKNISAMAKRSHKRPPAPHPEDPDKSATENQDMNFGPLGLQSDFPQLTKQEIKAKQAELRAQGLKPGQIHQAITDLRKQTTEEGKQYVSRLLANPDLGATVKHPKQFMKNVLRGRGPAMRRLSYLTMADELLGNRKIRDAATGHASDLATALKDPDTLVNHHGEQRPVYDEFGQTMGNWIDPATGEVRGLDPKYEADFRRRGTEMIQGASQDTSRSQADQYAQAGIDPRSGIAREGAYRTKMGGLQAGLNLESTIGDMNQQAMRQREAQLGQRSALEEGARHGYTSEDLARLGQAEGYLGGAWGGESGDRQFDLTYTEGQKQNSIRRADLKRLIDEAGKDRGPSTFEKVAAGLDSFQSGFQGGGTKGGTFGAGGVTGG